MTRIASIVNTEFVDLEIHNLTDGRRFLVETGSWHRPYVILHPCYKAAEAAAQELTRDEVFREYERLTDYSKPIDETPFGQGWRNTVRSRRLKFIDAARQAMAAY